MEDREQQLSPLSAGEVALGTLLDDSAHLRPDEVPGAVRRKAALVGLQEATIYLIDDLPDRQAPAAAAPFPSGGG